MSDIKELLKLMAERGASDLFISAEISPHMKIDGVTQPVYLPANRLSDEQLNAPHAQIPWPALKPGESKKFAYELMSSQQRKEFEKTKECNFALASDHTGRYRINVYNQRGEVSVAVRLIKAEIPTFDVLGVPPQAAQLALLKRGLVLMAGAAGTGKSTTLAAMVGYRAKLMDGHILTIEDPIEFLFSHGKSLVEQREVGIDTLTFGDALKNAMREAPDVIVIGEIRDRETAQHAIMYAEAGALCISTLHSNNANQAVDRLINFFPEEARKQVLLDLSLNLKGVISQRLIPSLEGGLVLATEILLQSAYSADLIQKGQIDTLKDAIKKGTEVGMQLFDDCLFKLYKQRKISLEEALHHADSRTDLSLKVKLS
ncbi:MAG: PilT/PilU family type 4a pilus ATPase [Sulfurimicrobium sp.]|nr:PilT/PilU family type 4a pilus ATPase [Sulfurimicrobium sp.]MDP1704867.1 PilT/PilU family type 4a pilus ATPase [Sulfurimicrobium sp.]MDP2199957.1 PilT/PilU family type 4a pilus ATPase [Sulfurimicrobium sp.]MDP2963692.1 PilT/PilU family type 4a pilus ATPase [Sulfurimicrobium sp.]MDP3688697.1 PilT/PilU family type 4a pilus ATPase [Sulfurimicrobium sp.]